NVAGSFPLRLQPRGKPFGRHRLSTIVACYPWRTVSHSVLDADTLARSYARRCRRVIRALPLHFDHLDGPVSRGAGLIVKNRRGERPVLRVPDRGDHHAHALWALGVDAPQAMHGRNTTDREHVRCRAHVHLVRLGQSQHIGEAAAHDLREPVVDRLLIPEITATIPYPLEV